MRLLVVEDEPDLAAALARGLRQEGYAVDVALDGELITLSTPLRFVCRPKALRVLVPPGGESAD